VRGFEGASQRFIMNTEKVVECLLSVCHVVYVCTNTGNNRASIDRCREGGSEDASRANQSIGGVVPQLLRHRRRDTS
jgi:hypothetical protein